MCRCRSGARWVSLSSALPVLGQVSSGQPVLSWSLLLVNWVLMIRRSWTESFYSCCLVLLLGLYSQVSGDTKGQKGAREEREDSLKASGIYLKFFNGSNYPRISRNSEGWRNSSVDWLTEKKGAQPALVWLSSSVDILLILTWNILLKMSFQNNKLSYTQVSL